MIKVLNFLILLAISKGDYSQNMTTVKAKECANVNIANQNNCNSINFNDQYNRCCFVNFTLGKTTFEVCNPISIESEQFKAYKKLLKETKSLKIECSSYIIKISILIYLCLFFL